MLLSSQLVSQRVPDSSAVYVQREHAAIGGGTKNEINKSLESWSLNKP